VISSHYIHNISYCTQDLEDRSVLAYIAKDQKANAHYCHVFKANSPVCFTVASSKFEFWQVPLAPVITNKTVQTVGLFAQGYKRFPLPISSVSSLFCCEEL
jgi:hypothetical protein